MLPPVRLKGESGQAQEKAWWAPNWNLKVGEQKDERG